MSVLQRIGVALIAAVLAIQLIPVDRSNPVSDPGKSIYATEAVPPAARSILQRSCEDCHSDQTRWPWYSRVAPVSWLVANDVHGARRTMNLSEWGTYTEKKKSQKREAICDQLLNDEMPDGKYTFVHRNARVSKEERQIVCQWTQSVP